MIRQATDKAKISIGRYLLATAIPTAFVLILVIFYINSLNKDIQFTAEELNGLGNIGHAFHASLAIKDIRGMRQFQFAGSRAFDAGIVEKQQLFNKIINTLISLQHNDRYGVKEALATLQQQTQALNQLAPAENDASMAIKQFDAYSKQIDTLYNLSLQIADHSNLVLEFEHEAFHMTDIAVRQLPLITEHFGQLRGRTVNRILNNNNRQQSALDIYYHIKTLKEHLHKLLTERHEVSSETTELQFTQPQLEKLTADFQSYIEHLERKENQSNTLPQASKLFMEGSALIVTSANIFNLILSDLNTLHNNRLQGLYFERRLTISIGLLSILLMIFFIGSFYRINRKALDSVLQAQQETESAERQQHSILQNMVDGVITIDEECLIHSINPAGEQIFGYSQAELLGKNVKMLMPEPYHDNHDIYVTNYLTTGEKKIIGIGRQVTGLRKNGQTFPMDLAVSEIRFKKKRMFSGTVRDISERIKAEEVIQASAYRLQTIMNHVVDGIITINKNGLVQSFNPAAENIFGYKAHEVIGHNVKMLMPSPYHEEHDGYLEHYQKTGKAQIIGIGREVEGKRKDGSIFPMDLAVSEMLLDGQVMYSGIVRDITERKQMERMKNEFISTVSHELRTPLTSIRGSLGLVMSETIGKIPKPIKDMLTITANNTERLLSLINDILDIQKIESGMMAFRFHSLELKSFIEKAITMNQSYADQFDVRFILKSAPDNIRVYADDDRLMQVMSNLMSNAAKFSPHGDDIEINIARHNGAIRISISDHGPGIPEDFRDKLFEKFTQYDSTDTRQKGGTGLGLSITRLIVEKHGGRIDYVSQSNIGTTFYIELPELISDLSTGIPPIELKGKHVPCVLIVEDDPDVAALIQRMLAEAGFNSDIASTAAQARKLLQEKGDHYKAMTLDLILPDEDGIDLLTSIRQKEQTRDLPVIVVSIKADETRRELNGGAIGILDWINKPFDQLRLQHVVKHAAGSNSLPRILHVEDEQDIHMIVSKMLQHDCELAWTTTVSAAKDILEEEDFDMVLLDISLPDGSGLDLLETIERRVIPPRVVIFSAQNVDPEIAQQVNSVLIKSHTTNKQLLETITSAIEQL